MNRFAVEKQRCVGDRYIVYNIHCTVWKKCISHNLFYMNMIHVKTACSRHRQRLHVNITGFISGCTSRIRKFVFSKVWWQTKQQYLWYLVAFRNVVEFLYDKISKEYCYLKVLSDNGLDSRFYQRFREGFQRPFPLSVLLIKWFGFLVGW